MKIEQIAQFQREKTLLDYSIFGAFIDDYAKQKFDFRHCAFHSIDKHPKCSFFVFPISSEMQCKQTQRELLHQLYSVYKLLCIIEVNAAHYNWTQDNVHETRSHFPSLIRLNSVAYVYS